MPSIPFVLPDDAVAPQDLNTEFVERLVDEFVDKFGNIVGQYEQPFLTRVADYVSQQCEKESGFMEEILPENTRLISRKGDQTCVVIEYTPRIHTLFFKYSPINEGVDYKTAYKLALPYMIMVPIFVKTDRDQYRLRGMCTGVRTAPLTKPDDWIHYSNLPNLCRPNDPSVPITTWVELQTCLGKRDDRKPFLLYGSSIRLMTDELMRHFWSSAYTNELVITWYYINQREPRMKDLHVWEKSSQRDPLFPLQVKWPKAVTVRKLLNMIFADKEHQDHHTPDPIRAAVREYVSKVHHDVWNGLLKIAPGLNCNLSGQFKKKWEEFLYRFTKQLTQGMQVITSDTIRRTVTIAIKEAIRGAV